MKGKTRKGGGEEERRGEGGIDKRRRGHRTTRKWNRWDKQTDRCAKRKTGVCTTGEGEEHEMKKARRTEIKIGHTSTSW